MEQEKDLRDGIILAVADQLRSFKEEIVKKIEDRFSGVDVRFSKIDRHFEKIDKRFESVDRHFANIDGRFMEMNKRFESVDKRFTGMDRRFEKQDVFLGGFKEYMDTRFRHQGVILEDIQGNVKAIAEGQDGLHKRIDCLEERVTVLEKNSI